MKISDDIKQKIQQEYDNYVNIQYGTKTKEERQKLGQFFTPPELSIQMIEKYDDLNGTILDPAVGCGRVISSMYNCSELILKNVIGIELDETIARLCIKRLRKFRCSK